MKNILIIIMFFLSACESTIMKASYESCSKYGFKEGTDGFANCILTEGSERRKRIDQGLIQIGGSDATSAYMAVNHPEYYSDYQEQADRRKMIQQQEETNTRLFFLNSKLNSY